MSRKQSKQSIERLLRQYPFLRTVYEREADVQVDTELTVNIRVQRGDADLLFRVGENLNGINSSLFSRDYPGQKGTQTEYFWPVNKQYQLGEMRAWFDRRDSSQTRYVRNMFERPIQDWASSYEGENPFEAINSLVWVTRNDWYLDETDLEERIIRTPLRVTVYITLYQAPKQGWRELYARSDPMRNVTLHGWTLIPGADPLKDPFIRALYDRFGRLCREFEQKVWHMGLGEMIDSSRRKGMSGTFGSVQLLSYVMAGRVQLVFRRGDLEFIMVGQEVVGEPRLGCNGVHGTAQQVEGLVREVMKVWQRSDEMTRRTLHTDDDKVGIAF